MQLTANQGTAVIAQLFAGDDYPGGSINSRRYDQKEVEAMKESILKFGVLQTLLVLPDPKAASKLYVAAGNLRRLAIAELVKEKKLSAEYEVPVMRAASADAIAALEASLEENRMRRPLHPVNTYEVFADLMEKGRTPADIAAMYGLDLKQTHGYLALGQLSPKIRRAWLAGEIQAEAAQAYTLTADHKRQDSVFTKQMKRGKYYAGNAHEIRRAIVGDEGSHEGLMTFVGKKDYEAAGGKIRDDLFGSNPVVENPDILAKLAEIKLEEEKARLLKEGWGDVQMSVSADIRGPYYSWMPVDKDANATNKKKATAIIYVDHDGKVGRMFRVKPGRKLEKEQKGGVKKGAAKISRALAQRLESMNLRAVKDALGAVFNGGLAAMLAKTIAEQIVPERPYHMPGAIDIDKITAELPDDLIYAALLKRFDLADYCKGAPRAILLKAIADCGADAKALKSHSKGALQTVIADKKFGGGKWLPPELRWAGYKGPGAKPGKKKARK